MGKGKISKTECFFHLAAFFVEFDSKMIINMTSKYTKWGYKSAKNLLILTESPILSFRYSLESSLSQQRSDVSPPYFIRLIRYKNLRSRVGESDLQISKLLIFTQFSFKLISNWSLNFPGVCYFPMPQIMDTPVSRVPLKIAGR